MTTFADRFPFCPRCGHAATVQTEHDQRVPVCQRTSCGFIFWQNAKPCACALIANKAGHVLLTRRNIAPDRGLLDLPGGYLNPDEEPISGLKREIKEELGVSIHVGDCVGHIIDGYGAEPQFNLIIGFAATITEGAPQVADKNEISELVWVDPCTIDPHDLAFKNNEKMLKLWCKNQLK